MELVYSGRTKNVYLNDGENEDEYVLKYKDDIKGKKAMKINSYYFNKLKENNIPTHYIRVNNVDNSMIVKKAQIFGKGIEVLCRYKAIGCFVRRYGDYIKEGTPLDGFVEFAVKKKKKFQDSKMSLDVLKVLNLMTEEEFNTCKKYIRKVSQIVRDDMEDRGLEIDELRLEFGKVNNKINVIDEICCENMRVFKNGTLLSYDNLIEIL